jgi:hypothetical protein
LTSPWQGHPAARFSHPSDKPVFPPTDCSAGFQSNIQNIEKPNANGDDLPFFKRCGLGKAQRGRLWRDFSQNAELFPHNSHNRMTRFDFRQISNKNKQISAFWFASLKQQEGMGMSIQTQSPRAPASGPPSLNPLRLASATVKAVDQLGVTTSNEIEKTADEIMRGATEIAAKLRELADAIRQHTEIASGQVESFCTKATSVFESVVELQEKLRVNGHGPRVEPVQDAPEPLQKADGDEPLPLPAFIKMGPADPSEL